MKKQKKSQIQNYQILDTLEEYEKQCKEMTIADSILLARNVNDKKYYSLKKLSLGEDSEALYDALLNQAKILKSIKHENIITCYRMFKISSKLYIVYGYEEGNTLDEVLELGPKALTFPQKQNIAKQLCLALSELQKNLVVHLNVKPQSIFLNKKLNVTLKEFMFSMEVPEDGQLDIKHKIPKSQFVAPEVRRGIASQQGDVYSFGKVLEKLDFTKCKRDQSGKDNSKRLSQLEMMIKGMVAKDRFQRYTLTDVYQTLFSKLKKVRRMRSRSESLLGSQMTEASLASSKFTNKNNKLISDILLKIMQQRNMSLLLVRLFRTVTAVLKFNSEHTVLLGFLLLKKSTKMLANLGKYLRYGKNDIGIDINPKELSKFSKATDYFKITQLLDKEIAVQKKEFEKAATMIFTHNSALFKHQDFNQQLKNEPISQAYFAQLAKEYLTQMLEKGRYLNELKEEALTDLVLVSYIAAQNSFEEFFRNNFPIDQLLIDEQKFIKKYKGMPKILMVQEIEKNVKWNKEGPTTNIRDSSQSGEENMLTTTRGRLLRKTQEQQPLKETGNVAPEGPQTERPKREAMESDNTNEQMGLQKMKKEGMEAGIEKKQSQPKQQEVYEMAEI